MNAETRLNYYLFARPSLVVGAASILDLGNTLFIYNDSPTGEAADYFAIKSDWMAVGEDLSEAANNFAEPDGQLELIPSSVGT